MTYKALLNVRIKIFSSWHILINKFILECATPHLSFHWLSTAIVSTLWKAKRPHDFGICLYFQHLLIETLRTRVLYLPRLNSSTLLHKGKWSQMCGLSLLWLLSSVLKHWRKIKDQLQIPSNNQNIPIDSYHDTWENFEQQFSLISKTQCYSLLSEGHSMH